MKLGSFDAFLLKTKKSVKKTLGRSQTEILSVKVDYLQIRKSVIAVMKCDTTGYIYVS